MFDFDNACEKMMVSWAMAVFGLKVWDIEPRSGWKTCANGRELARLAKDVQRGTSSLSF